jgi:polyferredoxin
MTTFFVSLPLFLILILLATIIGGAFYCGWLCPFGALQEVLRNVGTLMSIPQTKVPEKIHKYLVFSRYIFFGIAVGGFAQLLFFDARITFLDLLHGNKIALIAYSSVSIFMLLSLLLERPFCNYFCILGAKYGLFSAARILRIKRNEKTCIQCKKCDKVCPMHIAIAEKQHVYSLQCINCFMCISSCPKKKTLQYSLINKKDVQGILLGIKKECKKNKNNRSKNL